VWKLIDGADTGPGRHRARRLDRSEVGAQSGERHSGVGSELAPVRGDGSEICARSTGTTSCRRQVDKSRRVEAVVGLVTADMPAPTPSDSFGLGQGSP
jgi:hypothetical protein